MKKASGWSNNKSIPMSKMKKVIIPVPPMKESNHLFSLVELFDNLCNVFSSGIRQRLGSTAVLQTFPRIVLDF